jgi:hypothetical protein
VPPPWVPQPSRLNVAAEALGAIAMVAAATIDMVAMATIGSRRRRR